MDNCGLDNSGSTSCRNVWQSTDGSWASAQTVSPQALAWQLLQLKLEKVDKLGGVHLGKQHTRMKVAFEFGSWVFEPKAMGRRSHGSAIPDAWALRYLC